MIKILLAEDHSVVRNGIKSLLINEPGFNVCGEGINGQQIIRLLHEGLSADVILADINMPDMSGIELIKKVKEKFPEILVVVLSMVDHERNVFEAFQAGARGYLLKNVDSDEMFFAIRQVHLGNKYLCIELSNKLLEKFHTVNISVSKSINIKSQLLLTI